MTRRLTVRFVHPRAIVRRLMDSRTTTDFHPDALSTRGADGRDAGLGLLDSSEPDHTARVHRRPGDARPYVQAVTSAGGPMRDTFMQSGPVVDAPAAHFSPTRSLARRLATWLVRALGKDADAQAAMKTATSYTTTPTFHTTRVDTSSSPQSRPHDGFRESASPTKVPR